MTEHEASILASGQRVGLVVAKYPNEVADFVPLAAAEAGRAEEVAAIEAKVAGQDATTTGTTTDKEAARELLAVAADLLSTRAVGYALALKDLGLKQALTLTYSDVRHGDATEDVNHVRELVARVRALPAQVRKDYRLTEALTQAPLDAADLFGQAADTQTEAKAAPRLATLALPELLRRLSATLVLLQTLLKGQRTDADPDFHWADFYAAFLVANKRRGTGGPKGSRATPAARIVRTLPLTAPDDQPHRLANTNYGPAYTLTVENRSAHALRLWMAQKDGAPTTPATCPAGQVTTLTRAALGPETARYLMAQFEGAGGEATVVVRRVV